MSGNRREQRAAAQGSAPKPKKPKHDKRAYSNRTKIRKVNRVEREQRSSGGGGARDGGGDYDGRRGEGRGGGSGGGGGVWSSSLAACKRPVAIRTYVPSVLAFSHCVT